MAQPNRSVEPTALERACPHEQRPTNPADRHAALRTSARSDHERAAVNLLIVAGWIENAGFRDACLDHLSAGRIEVDWCRVRAFIHGHRIGHHGDADPGHPDALLTRAHNLATGRIESSAVLFVRFMTTGTGVIVVLCSDGTTSFAESDRQARQVVPSGVRIVAGDGAADPPSAGPPDGSRRQGD